MNYSKIASYLQYILNEIAQNCYKIATCQSGYSVVQTCVERSQGEYRDRLVAEIIAYGLHLAEDLYGFVSMNLTNGPFPIPLQHKSHFSYFSLHVATLWCNIYWN